MGFSSAAEKWIEWLQFLKMAPFVRLNGKMEWIKNLDADLSENAKKYGHMTCWYCKIAHSFCTRQKRVQMGKHLPNQFFLSIFFMKSDKCIVTLYWTIFHIFFAIWPFLHKSQGIKIQMSQNWLQKTCAQNQRQKHCWLKYCKYNSNLFSLLRTKSF